MGIGRKIWQWNLKSAPLYWFAQGKYKKGLGLWAMWIALWTILAFAFAPKPKPKQSINLNERKEYTNA